MAAAPTTLKVNAALTQVRAASRRFKNGAGVALLLILIGWAIFHFDWHATAHAMGRARWGLLAMASIVAVTVCISASSLRLWLLTVPIGSLCGPIQFRHFNDIYYASCAAHHLLPAPAAEVLRTVHLQKHHGYPLSGLIGSQLIEKIADALGLTLEMLVVVMVTPLPSGMKSWLVAFVSATLVTFGLLLWLSKARGDKPNPNLGSGLRTAFANLQRSIRLLSTPRTWFACLALSILIDGANAVTVGLVTHALGLHLPWTTWYVVVLVARLAGLLPSTPGQFGVVEAGVVVALSFQGVERNLAFACALLYHLAHFIPVTVVGLWKLKKIWTAT